MASGETAWLHAGGHDRGGLGTWGNLGLWAEGEVDYAKACQALAQCVGETARIQAGDHVLSVACGAGDELALWQDHFGAASVWGVEQDAARVAAARRLNSRVAAQVKQGDGCALLTLGLPPQSFARVLCVDAAYHLQPREAFLQAAHTLLMPGGRLAYTDLCLHATSRGWRALLLRAAAWLCGLRADELVSPDRQAQRLQALGFVDVHVQTLDEAVLGGFVRHVGHLRAQEQGHGLRVWQRDGRRAAITARLITACRAAGLGYVLVAGSRERAKAAATP